MLANYLIATFRRFLKNKIDFLFKLGGLTLGLTSFLAISLYVSFQLSYDRYHNDYKNIYRVNSNRDEAGKIVQFAMVPPAIGPAIQTGFPEVVSIARVSEAERALIKYNGNLMRSGGLVEADAALFDVFTFDLLRGDKHALKRPSTIVLTEALARQIFGDEDPIGKLISLPDKGNRPLEVAAVINALPANTHLNISAIISFATFNSTDAPLLDSWEIGWDGSVYLYVRLNKSTNPDQFSDKVNPMIAKNIAKSGNEKATNFSVFLQPIADIYLGPAMQMEFFQKGNSLYVYIFSLLGLLLLLVSSINYINLSIADFHNRSKEFGIRKSFGARKAQIAFQITLEACFICIVALLISLGILYFLLPGVIVLLEPNLNFGMLFDKHVLALTAVTVSVLTIVSTAYPAFRLSISSPVRDLKSGLNITGNQSVGRTLLIAQFVISVISISATWAVSNQVEYIQTEDLGYDRANVISLIMPEEYPLEKAQVLKDEVARLAGIVSASYSHYHMTGVPYFKSEYEVEINNVMTDVTLNEVFVDHDYLKTLGLRILTGRNFDIKNPADSHKAFIVNEAAVRSLGWIDPIGKKIRIKQDRGDVEKWEGIVIGVVKDFNTRPLREKIEPMVMRLPYDSWPGNCLNLKFERTLTEMLPVLKETYEKILPGYLIEYRIIEDMFDNQYAEENKALAALQIGTWMMLLISSVGIFSLSFYMSIRRMKEFGIRKVLGASTTQIILLHVGSFMKIALIANVIALPVAFWLMKEWLDGFAYRTQLGGVVFLVAAVVSFLLVIASAGYPSLRAGKMNPVDVIKSE